MQLHYLPCSYTTCHAATQPAMQLHNLPCSYTTPAKITPPYSHATPAEITHSPHHAGAPGSLMAFPPDPGNVVSSAPWPAPMAGSRPGSVTGQVADCGFGLVQCSRVEGKVCLLQRGANFYCRWVWVMGFLCWRVMHGVPA
jgi:hypothetical protein